MNEPDMNEPYVGGTALRAMLERATAGEQLIGPVVQNALVAGLKRRRHRRASGIVACAVVVVVVSVVAPALARAHSTTPAPAGPAGTPTVYVSNHSSSAAGRVTPISAATDTAGPAIKVGGYPYAIVIAP
jgi:hypothetical protein